MTRAYVLDPVTRATLGLVDQSWERLSYTRRYTAMDTFELAINRTRLWASELRVGCLLYLPDEGDLVFLVEQIASIAEGSTRNDEMTVTGRSLEGIAMAERLVEPPAGESHDRQVGVPAETAIKHYVRAHAADLAAVARQVPGLVVAPDAARGPTVTANGRFQTVLDLVREIALVAGLGWEITYDPASSGFRFDVTDGVDRSASVFFDFAFETLERWEELTSVIDAKTVALVAGQGEGIDRDLVTRWTGSEPTGFDRREAFLDARDVEAGETTVLAQRGDAFLAAIGPETSFEADVHQYGGFRYREQWDVGDVVTVRNAERELAYAARVVEVEKAFERSAAAPMVRAMLGRPFPTLQSRTTGGAGGPADSALGATGPAGGDLAGTYPDPSVIDDSHDHSGATAPGVADTAGPDAHVTVDAAGAAGTPGSRSRAGHGHQLQTSAATPAAVGIDSGASAGSAGAVARAGHAHQLATSSTTPARASIAGSAGTSGTVARAAHAHPTTAPIRRVYTSSTTWTKPANIAHIDVEVVGGGGGGGGAAATAAGESSSAGSGGGAGYARGLFTAAEMAGLSSGTVTVGAAGSAGTAGNNSGGGGGTSSFAGAGITTISATGGGGGNGGSATSGNARSTGGSRGAGSGGDVNSTGSHGGGGTVIGGAPALDSIGGASVLGGGGRKESSSSGQPGGAFGGGGAGATNAGSNAARAGSAGAAGVVIVTEHYF